MGMERNSKLVVEQTPHTTGDHDSLLLCRTEKCEACSLVLYGHTARVWDARLLPDYIVSISEDTTCRVWDYKGRCVEAVEGHTGRGIWSLAVNVENSVVVRSSIYIFISIAIKLLHHFLNKCTWHAKLHTYVASFLGIIFFLHLTAQKTEILMFM